MDRLTFLLFLYSIAVRGADLECTPSAELTKLPDVNNYSAFQNSNFEPGVLFYESNRSEFFRYDSKTGENKKVFECDRTLYTSCYMEYGGVIKAQRKPVAHSQPKIAKGKGKKQQSYSSPYSYPDLDFIPLDRPQDRIEKMPSNGYIRISVDRRAMLHMKIDQKAGRYTTGRYQSFGGTEKNVDYSGDISRYSSTVLDKGLIYISNETGRDATNPRLSFFNVDNGQMETVPIPGQLRVGGNIAPMGTSGWYRLEAYRQNPGFGGSGAPLLFNAATRELVNTESFLGESAPNSQVSVSGWGNTVLIRRGRQYLIAEPGADGKLKEVSKGEVESGESIHFSRDGKVMIVTGDGSGSAKLFHLSGKQLGVIRPAEHTEEGLSASPANLDLVSADQLLVGGRTVAKLKFGCAMRIVDDGPEDLECKEGVAGEAGSKAGRPLIDALLNTSCQEKYNAAEWDSLTGSPPGIGEDLPRWRAELFLRRFEKPRGFEPKHTKLLYGLADLYKNEPEKLEGVMTRLFFESPDMFQRLLTRNPDMLSRLGNKPIGEKFCRSKEEDADLGKMVISQVERDFGSSNSYGRVRDFQQMNLFRRYLRNQKPEWKEEYKDKIAQRLADVASANSELAQGVFASKLYYMSLNGVRALFGEEVRPISDLTVVRQREDNRVVLLGAYPSEGSDSSFFRRFGFYARDIAKYRNSEINGAGDGIGLAVNWKFADKEVDGEPVRYSGEVKLVPSKERFIPNPQPAPDYKALWKDGKMTGAIIMGVSMEDPVDLMDEYLEYYKQNGFKTESGVVVPDLVGWLQEKVQGGELDYLLKEAHSDGDDKNIFRIERSAKVVVGRRQAKEGQEVVYLVYPTGTNRDFSKSVNLSNQAFGQWMKDRAKAGGGPLVYFNTSCGSVHKAVSELSAAGTNLFVNLPSNSLAVTFENNKSSGAYQMLDGFRNQKSYADIRKGMATSVDYQRGADRYLFPDMPEYKTAVTDRLRENIDVEVRIKDGKGNDYHMDEHIH